MLSEEETQRRIRAARALRGKTVDQLAEMINEPGLKSGTLGAIERGERPARRRELRSIADALGLPYEFFTIEDFAVLGPLVRERPAPELLAVLGLTNDAQVIEAAFGALAGEALNLGREQAGLEVSAPSQAANFDEIAERLERIEAALADGLSIDYTRLAVETGRELTSSALASAGVAGETQAVDQSRGEGDAIAEVPEAPAQETARTERGAGG